MRERRSFAAAVAPTRLRYQFDVDTAPGETISRLLFGLDEQLGARGYVLARQTATNLEYIRIVKDGRTIGLARFDSGLLLGSLIDLPPDARRVGFTINDRHDAGSRITVLGVGEPWMCDWLNRLVQVGLSAL